MDARDQLRDHLQPSRDVHEPETLHERLYDLPPEGIGELIAFPKMGRTVHKYVLVECHGMLGQVAAKRGQLEEASGHFGRALEEAKASRLPMLELLTARDWKQAVASSSDAAEAVIDVACAKMGKSRSDLHVVLR